MRIHRSFAILAAALVAGSCLASAQAAPAAGFDPTKQILQTVQRFENNLMALAKAMPADKYNFAPSSEIFKAGSPAKFDTVRTFAQQLTHVAGMSFQFYAPFGVEPDPSIDVKNLDKITSKDEVLKVLQASFDMQNKAIAGMTTENAFTPKGPRNMTLVAAILVVMGDDDDHYGQLVEYGRMNGIIPPATEQNAHTAPPVVQQK